MTGDPMVEMSLPLLTRCCYLDDRLSGLSLLDEVSRQPLRSLNAIVSQFVCRVSLPLLSFTSLVPFHSLSLVLGHPLLWRALFFLLSFERPSSVTSAKLFSLSS